MSDLAPIPEEDCLAAWCAGDDWCAITCTMDVLGKKWHPVIVHRLLVDGPLRFNELATGIGPITNKVLSNGLQDLQDQELVERSIINDQPVEVEYALTPHGRSLEPVIDALEEWGRAHLNPGESAAESVC